MVDVESTNQLKCNDKCNIDDEEEATKRNKAAKKLFVAVGLCIVFIIGEVIGGVISNSLAILTDAAHLLSDIAGFAIALFAIYASGWEANPRQTFGYYRLEILGALLSIQIIWLVTGVLVYEAIVRFIHPDKDINGLIMFCVASGGLGINIIIMCTLGHEGHGHSHGHSHGHDDHDDHSHDHDSHKKSHKHDSEHHHKKKHNHDDEHKDDDLGHHKSKKGFYAQLWSCFGRKKNHHHKGESGIAKAKNVHKLHDDEEDNEVHEIKIIEHKEEGNPKRSRSMSVKLDNEISIIEHKEEDNPKHSRSMSVKLDKDLHSHKKKKKDENINVRAAYLHALGDFVQSIGVMIAGAIIWLKPELYIVDPICTIVFSVMVLATTYNMIREIVEILMESTPKEIDASAVEAGLLKIDGVVEVHELHIWAITVGRSLLACHIQATPNSDTNEVLHTVTNYVENVYNISHVTIQIEQRLS